MTTATRSPRTRRPRVKDPVEQYARDVLDGKVLAGELVKLACQRHLRDLDTAGERGLVWQWDGVNGGKHAVDFFQFLKQSKGVWANTPIKLAPWQVFRIGSVFGWKREDGTRRFREAWNEVPRKNGKTTEAAGVGNKLAFFDGEPGAEVYATATKRDQAKICWAEAKWQIDHAPVSMKKLIDRRVSNMSRLDMAQKFEPLGADKDGTDGLNPHGLIEDEIHAWKDRDYLDKLDTAMGARAQPLKWIITTAGSVESTLYLEGRDYAVKVLQGVFDDDSLFAYIACADDPDDWDSDHQSAIANPNLGLSVNLDYLQSQRAKARGIPARVSAYKRYHLNIIQQATEGWFDMTTWEHQMARRELEPGLCYAGLDMSSTTDLTSLVLVFPDDDGGVDVLPFFWCPEGTILRRSREDNVPYESWVAEEFVEAIPGDVIDYDFVEQRVLQICNEYGVQELQVDPWGNPQLRQHLADAGLNVIDCPQNVSRLSAPSKHLEMLVKQGRLRHDGNPVLKWMASNVVIRSDPNDNIKPDKLKSSDRIDGIVALVMAVNAVLSANEGPSVYEQRGLMTL